MLLLTTTFADYLHPYDNISDLPWYNEFTIKFSKMTIACIVSQSNLMPEMFGEDEKTLDDIIDIFIKKIPENSQRIRNNYIPYCLALSIEPGEVKQNKEQRIFFSEYFMKEAEKNKISSRKLIIRTMNANAFLNYFFLIEETIKSICHKRQSKKKLFTAKDMINNLLKSKLFNEGLYTSFNKEIYERSRFFVTFKSLSETWNLLTLIRNRYVHHGNIYDEKAKNNFKKIVEEILKELKSCEDCLTIYFFSKTIDNFQKQIDQSDSIMFDNVLENIIRNTSTFIIESLYICEIQKLKDKKS